MQDRAEDLALEIADAATRSARRDEGAFPARRDASAAPLGLFGLPST
jgi:hypothetical protein